MTWPGVLSCSESHVFECERGCVMGYPKRWDCTSLVLSWEGSFGSKVWGVAGLDSVCMRIRARARPGRSSVGEGELQWLTEQCLQK